MVRRATRDDSPPATSQPRLTTRSTAGRWFDFASQVFALYYEEQKEHAVRIRRKMWHRLGMLLQRHSWCKQYRLEYFAPVWCVRIVKKWVRLNALFAPRPRRSNSSSSSSGGQ